MKQAQMPNAETQPRSADTTFNEFHTRPPEMRQVLQVLEGQNVPLRVYPDGASESFQARILQLDSSGVLIDQVQPARKAALLEAGCRLSFTGRHGGLYVRGERSAVTEVASAQGEPYFRLAWPERMLCQQRRREPRFSLPRRVHPEDGTIELLRRRRDSEPVTGRLLDLSLSGCRVAIAGRLARPLELNEVVHRCELKLVKGTSVIAEGVIRHISESVDRQELICGLSLATPDVAQRRCLQRFIQSLSDSA